MCSTVDDRKMGKTCWLPHWMMIFLSALSFRWSSACHFMYIRGTCSEFHWLNVPFLFRKLFKMIVSVSTGGNESCCARVCVWKPQCLHDSVPDILCLHRQILRHQSWITSLGEVRRLSEVGKQCKIKFDLVHQWIASMIGGWVDGCGDSSRWVLSWMVGGWLVCLTLLAHWVSWPGIVLQFDGDDDPFYTRHPCQTGHLLPQLQQGGLRSHSAVKSTHCYLRGGFQTWHLFHVHFDMYQLL